jgi:hypothetical protein
MRPNMVGVKGSLAEIRAASLAFEIGGYEKLSDLARRETSTAIHARLHLQHSGLAPNSHVISQWPRHAVLTVSASLTKPIPLTAFVKAPSYPCLLFCFPFC